MVARGTSLVALLFIALESAAIHGQEAQKAVDTSTPSATTPVAQFPSTMDGWVKVRIPAFGNAEASTAWGIELATRNPDGSFTGTLKFNGRTCRFPDGVPMTGVFDGKTLQIDGVLGKCGKATFTLSPGKDHLFEGTYDVETLGQVTDKQSFLDAK